MSEVASAYTAYSVSWNLTQRCNLECAHCYMSAHAGADTRGELTTAECRRVIDEIARVNPSVFLILTGGEPLLRRDIFEVAGYASAQGFTTVLGTNGVLLREPEARRMREHGILGASISLDSTERARHDGFRRLPGAWDGAVRATRVLSDAGLDFSLHMSVTDWNVAEVPAMIDLARELGAKVLNFFFLVRTGRGRDLTDIDAAAPGAHQEEEVQDLGAEAPREIDHPGNLLHVPVGHRHVQREVQSLIAEHARGPHGGVPRAGQAPEPVVLHGIGGVEADGGAEHAVLAHEPGFTLTQEHTVGAEHRRELLLGRIARHVPDVAPQQRLAAGEDQEHVGIDVGDLVDHAPAFRGRQLTARVGPGVRGHVAMRALEVAPLRQIPRHRVGGVRRGRRGRCGHLGFLLDT